MATQLSPHCFCTDGVGPIEQGVGISWHAIAEALTVDDVDRAIDAGLLRWNGCRACAVTAGLHQADVERLHAARMTRLAALAARERFRARQHRLQQRSAQRDARRNSPGSAYPLQSALPSAAAAALARAKAKATARAK